jgi:hypothetical protein
MLSVRPCRTPKQVYGTMLAEGDGLEVPRNAQQIRYMKATRLARNSRYNHTASKMADEILNVLSMVGPDAFVQHVITTNDRTHCVMLYIDQDIIDIKKFCCFPNDSVLSFEKIYSLVSFYVTPSTYKTLALKHVCSGSLPMFVALCITQTSTHSHYFSYSYSRLSSADILHLTLGADVEHPMRNATLTVFCISSHITCTRQLKKNINIFLQQKIGSDAQYSMVVMLELFGRNGPSKT